MARPRADKLFEAAGGRYQAVIATSRRARQLNTYFHDDGSNYDEEAGPLVKTGSTNPLTIAEEEIVEGSLKVVPSPTMTALGGQD